eukprot:2751330-Amphidinium_carterae.1
MTTKDSLPARHWCHQPEMQRIKFDICRPEAVSQVPMSGGAGCLDFDIALCLTLHVSTTCHGVHGNTEEDVCLSKVASVCGGFSAVWIILPLYVSA